VDDKAIRNNALKLSVEMRNSTETTEAVVKRAEQFSSFIRTGDTAKKADVIAKITESDRAPGKKRGRPRKSGNG
jgi:hypothetical protein